jgi:NADH dehydrogenase [ubiquinone] 1 alpha subcomplex assembly factor 7
MQKKPINPEPATVTQCHNCTFVTDYLNREINQHFFQGLGGVFIVVSILDPMLARAWARLGRQALRPLSFEARPLTTGEARPPATTPPDEGKLLRELCGKIRLTGPITVAEYMREVATNPIHGFYISQEALGSQGHFVTSPEVSQMFGECLAVWYLNEWMKMGEPSQLQLVELGPGKGTLMADILRTLAALQPDMVRGVSVHLVEVSDRLRRQQEVALCGRAGGGVEGSALTSWGCPVTWHSGLREVPHHFSFFLAHEFLDALPINKYERTSDGWREVLVDLDPALPGPGLRWVLARHGTPSCVLLDRVPGAEKAARLELCPPAGLAVREVSRRLAAQGGAALLVDYGEAGGGDRDTLRAFKDHRQVDPLELPGTADITADVDWLYLRSQVLPRPAESVQVDEHAVMFGPTEQGAFLQACGGSLPPASPAQGSREGADSWRPPGRRRPARRGRRMRPSPTGTGWAAGSSSAASTPSPWRRYTLGTRLLDSLPCPPTPERLRKF